MNQTEIVAATPDDLDRLMTIEKQCQYHPWSLAVMSRYLNRPGVIWKAMLDQQLVGFAVVTRVVGEAELLDIAIDPAFQGKGLGQQLLQSMLDMVSAEGCERMFLEVRESNAAAIAVYEKLGFGQVGVRPGYYPSSHGREDALMYCQELVD